MKRLDSQWYFRLCMLNAALVILLFPQKSQQRDILVMWFASMCFMIRVITPSLPHTVHILNLPFPLPITFSLNHWRLIGRLCPRVPEGGITVSCSASVSHGFVWLIRQQSWTGTPTDTKPIKWSDGEMNRNRAFCLETWDYSYAQNILTNTHSWLPLCPHSVPRCTQSAVQIFQG